MLMMRSLHGSRLYGMETPTSDWDFFEVYDKLPKSRQILKNGFDIRQYSLSTFMYLASEGSPSFLEAMFAPDELVAVDRLHEMRKSYFCSAAKAHVTYRRTIRGFEKVGTPKAKRHMIRMERDLETLSKYGRFDPSVHSDLRGI